MPPAVPGTQGSCSNPDRWTLTARVRYLTFTLNDSVFYHGTFLTALVKFVLIAAAIFFLIVKPVYAMMSRTKKKPA